MSKRSLMFRVLFGAQSRRFKLTDVAHRSTMDVAWEIRDFNLPLSLARRCPTSRDLCQVAQRAAHRARRVSGPTRASRCVCQSGTQSQVATKSRAPSGWVLPRNLTRHWAAGTAALLDTVCFFSPGDFRPIFTRRFSWIGIQPCDGN